MTGIIVSRPPFGDSLLPGSAEWLDNQIDFSIHMFKENLRIIIMYALIMATGFVTQLPRTRARAMLEMLDNGAGEATNGN